MEHTGAHTPETYTFTARSARNPNNAATLTLVDHHLRVDLPDLLDALGGIATADEKLTEAGERLKSQRQPAALKAAEALTGPLALGDVKARLRGRRLTLTAWKRVGGLRVAPLRLSIPAVDNPDAAKAFVDTLKARQADARKRRWAGPLDYWFGWAGLMLGLLVLFKWSRRTAGRAA